MKISDVQIKMVTQDAGRLKAVASILIDDCFAVHDIKLIQGDNNIFIAMPSRKIPNGEFKDIAHPINSDTRELLRKTIMDAYERALKELAE